MAPKYSVVYVTIPGWDRSELRALSHARIINFLVPINLIPTTLENNLISILYDHQTTPVISERVEWF